MSSLSKTSSYILAAGPPAPIAGPVDDSTVSCSYRVKVKFPTLHTQSEIGGSAILSYNL